MVFTFHNKGFNLIIKENSCHNWKEPNTADRKKSALGKPNALLGYKTLGKKLTLSLEYRAFKRNLARMRHSQKTQ